MNERILKAIKNPIWAALLLAGLLVGEYVLAPLLLTILFSFYVLSKDTKKEFRLMYVFLIYGLFLLLHNHLRALAFIGGLYVIDILFTIALKYIVRPFYKLAPIGLELVLFNTVLAGFYFGPTAGIITGLLFGTTYYGILFSFNSIYQFINIPAYGVVGYFAGVISMSFVPLGILLAVLYALITSALITVALGGRPGKALIFIATNITFNAILFTSFSPWVLALV